MSKEWVINHNSKAIYLILLLNIFINAKGCKS